MSKLHEVSVHETLHASASITASVKRGEKSWQILLVFLGFFLTIEGTVVSMFDIVWWAKILTFLGVAALTSHLVLDNGWTQNKIIGLYNRIAEKSR